MKKTIVSFAATAVLSTTFVSTAAANTYKVESGDSLWSIAKKYDLTVANLKQVNKLNSDLIYPNQVLKLSAGSDNTSSAPAAPAAPPETEQAKSYTVKSGDTLLAIANAHSITLGELQGWNSIKSHLIYPGQKLIVSKSSSQRPVSAEPPVSKPAPDKQPAEPATGSYTVKSGDTLSHISINYNVSVSAIKKYNNLKSDMIYVGQVLKLGTSQAAQPEQPSKPADPDPQENDTSFNADQLISLAKAQLGKPYVWGGSTTSGFDCSGFIYYAFNKAGVKVTRTSSEGYYNRSFYVNKPVVGDLVFFENTYKKGISHLGIYVGDNKFIHAGDNGVEITSLDNSYWKSKFDGFKRFYEL
ncbi:LysM peptidoglycan-binding domain-containing protein [[Bacillus] enclensis]|uniref:LysM peptidoglycan-binding domain-containing protein n=1 Tax=[Bacillus] enclensis TaxID=1402860 RepID=UPI0018DD7503|nr:LysM peptidoglycan-binding domain-containing protein [[Bacillus] enclensis]